MVVAVRAVFVALLELLGVLAEALLALFAGEDHLGTLLEIVVLGLGMALGAVKPLLAAGAADGDLGVEDVLAAAERRRSAAARRGRGAAGSNEPHGGGRVNSSRGSGRVGGLRCACQAWGTESRKSSLAWEPG